MDESGFEYGTSTCIYLASTYAQTMGHPQLSNRRKASAVSKELNWQADNMEIKNAYSNTTVP